eukprot:16432038-Heterocapsa_arctica.AAC.1
MCIQERKLAVEKGAARASSLALSNFSGLELGLYTRRELVYDQMGYRVMPSGQPLGQPLRCGNRRRRGRGIRSEGRAARRSPHR